MASKTTQAATKWRLTPKDAASHTMDNILDFFPSSQGDGLNIIWAHGVNSHQQLDESLNDDTMMLETDIILRGIGTPNQTDIPVNAHPPATDSDLLTSDFINMTTLTPDKGMKLDFKYLEAVGPTMDIFLQLEDQVNCPLWINADIAKGPNSPKDPVDPVQFIDTANSYFNQTVMSLGFTTGWDSSSTEDLYTWTMIFDILQYTYPLDPQPVTYPVRAVWSVRSWPKLTWLLGLRETFSITVWTGSSDQVDIQGLVSLRTHGDIRRIFYDLPTVMREEFLGAMETGDPAPDEKPVSDWENDQWLAYSQGRGNFVFLSTESAGISGPAYRAGYMQSVQEYPAEAGISLVTVQGRIQFVDRYDDPSNEAAIEVFIHSDAIDTADSTIYSEEYNPTSLRLDIGRGGQVTLRGSESGVERNCQLPAAECYTFGLIDRGVDSTGDLEAWVAVATSRDATVADANEGSNCTLALTASEASDIGDQSLVVVTKRGGSGDIIIEDLSVVTSDPSSAREVVISVINMVIMGLSVWLVK